MKNVLAAIDFSEVSDRVIDESVELSRGRAHLWIVHVAAPDPDFVGYDVGPRSAREGRAVELRDEHRALQAIAERLRDEGLTVTALLVQGPTIDAIVGEADKVSADLIVVGSHGHGAIVRALVGSVSEGVLRRAARPVLVVPAPRAKDESEQ